MFLIKRPHIAVSMLVLLLFSCKSHLPDNNALNAIEKEIYCPVNGICSLSILSQKALHYKKDEFNMGYTEFVNADTYLLKYEYRQTEAPGTADGHYIEHVYLSIPKIPKVLVLKDDQLKSVNLLFERLCYCKGQTGFYKIDQGTLSLKRLDNKTYHLKLTFKTDEVAQRITKIDEIFTLNP